MGFKIFLSPPNMCGKELEYVKECFDTNWIAPYGPQLDAFEKEMASYISVDKALAVTSGTAAIHLALRWYDVKPGDIVFCSDFTFIGSCTPILYQNATPVFIDSEPDSWNMSPIALEKAFDWAKKENKMPKAVIIVDLYGESADWDNLLTICRKYGVPVIEDAAESVGTVYKGKKCGSFGDISVLSFNGNKIITTSGGGMLLSNNLQAVEKMRFWATQAREAAVHYEHKDYGYNYRMSNICAAIGRGQLTCIDEKIEKRISLHERYIKEFESIPAHIKLHADKGRTNSWLNLLHVDTDEITPMEIVTSMQNAQIETRPAWKPMHMQPLFADEISFPHYDDSYVGEEVFARSLCLPSGDGMKEEQIDFVVSELKNCFAK